MDQRQPDSRPSPETNPHDRAGRTQRRGVNCLVGNGRGPRLSGRLAEAMPGQKSIISGTIPSPELQWRTHGLCYPKTFGSVRAHHKSQQQPRRRGAGRIRRLRDDGDCCRKSRATMDCLRYRYRAWTMLKRRFYLNGIALDGMTDATKEALASVRKDRGFQEPQQWTSGRTYRTGGIAGAGRR